MTKAQDVREAIAENSISPAERRNLESLAERLDETLSEDVPYRPQFKAELRRSLVAQARRQMTPPWYRRPAVWGTTFAAAAAVTILAVGLQLWGEDAGLPGAPGNVAQTEPKPAAKPGTGPSMQPREVNTFNLPVVEVAPEVLPAGHPGPEALGAAEKAQALNVYLVSGRPDRDQFVRMAQGLGVAGPVQPAATGFSATQGSRTLAMTADGHVTYKDTAASGAAGAQVNADVARDVARSFLENAALPIPTLTPAVLVNNSGIWAVEYTPRVDGRAVVNARTMIQVSPGGKVMQADAYVQQTNQAQGPYDVIPPQEALQEARKAGDATYDGVDLVYVRTPDRGAVYLQPYWRVFGATPQGGRLVRYVPALRPGR